jgi:hypothetical protein
MCASLDNAGGAAAYGSPQQASPDLVSQIQGPPGPSLAEAACCRARQRAAIARARGTETASAAASWSSCSPYISPVSSIPAASLADRSLRPSGPAVCGARPAPTTRREIRAV